MTSNGSAEVVGFEFEQLSLLPTKAENITDHPVVANAINDLPDIPESPSANETKLELAKAHGMGKGRVSKIYSEVENGLKNGSLPPEPTVEWELARSYLAEDTTIELEKFVGGKLHGTKMNVFLSNKATKKNIVEQVGESAEILRWYDQASEKNIPEIIDEVTHDDLFAMTVIDFLGGDDKDRKVEDFQPGAEDFLRLIAYEHYSPSRDTGRKSLLQTIMDRVENGELDHAYAKRAIETYKTADPEDIEGISRGKTLRQIIDLTVATRQGIDEQQAIELACSPSTIGSWTLRAQNIVTLERQKSLDGITKNMERLNYSLKKGGILQIGTDINSDLEAAINHRSEEAIALAAAYGANIPGIPKAEVMRLRAQQKGNGVKKSPAGPKPEILRDVPRDLFQINHDGTETQIDDGEIPEPIKEYARKHHSGSKEAEEKVMELIDRVRILDLSSGGVAGLVKHEDDFKVNGVVVGDMYQLRPDKIAGTGVGRVMKQSRILCTFADDKIAIYLMDLRTNIRRQKRNHKMSTGGQRGNK